MNRAYKLVWNRGLQGWVVASELATGKKKSAATTLKAALLLAGSVASTLAMAVPAANTLPSGEFMLMGTGTFDRTVANQLTVTQSTQTLLTLWDSFSVGKDAKVMFNQPSSNSVAINSVRSGNVSEIFGQIQSNGQFVLTNPAGIVFGAGSQVDASAIVASTIDWVQAGGNNTLTLDKALNGSLPLGNVENHGTLTATAGSVTLLGPSIINDGVINATGGNVNLMNADRVFFNASEPAVENLSSVTGSISSTGNIQATAVNSVGGRIVLTGDKSQAASKLILGGALLADDAISVDATNINISSALALGNNTTLSATDSIVFGADTTLATDKALSLNHGTGAGQGYFLDHAAKVNLNGAGAAFSVNGSAYTVIHNLSQLTDITSNLAGKYVVASDIDAQNASIEPIAPYNSGVGNVGPFTGTFDGLGHAISNLVIMPSGYNEAGLFGKTSNASLSNIGLVNATVGGRNHVGALVGYMQDGSIVNSYATGQVSRYGANRAFNLGGLVGANYGGTISNSYASVNVSNDTGFSWEAPSIGLLGGLVGNNQGVISNSYATGVVSSGNNYMTIRMGGLAGKNGGTISNSYASGQITDNTANALTLTGGLVGENTGTVNSSYWNMDSSGLATSAAGKGLSTAQMQQQSSFNGWSIDNVGGTDSVWRIYEGQTAPLLRNLLKQVTLTTADATRTYDGTTSINSGHTSSNPLANLQGTAYYYTDSRNAGVQGINVGGLYSDQQGYDILVNKGTATINKANLKITSTSVHKVYDGTTDANGTAKLTGGTQLFGGDTISGGTFVFDGKNASMEKVVYVYGVDINDGNGGNNYNVTYVQNSTSSIDRALLTITATAASKVYDGTLRIDDKPIVTGRARGDSISGLSQSFADKNAGTGKAVLVGNGFVIRDGNGGNNYDVVVVDGTAGVITPKSITISTVTDSKVYDGGITSAAKPLVTGLELGDRITGLFQRFQTKTVGDNKQLLIKAGYVLHDGNGGNNYVITEQTSTDGSITPKVN